MWQDVSTAPFDREVETAVIGERIVPVAVPCIRTPSGWRDAATLKKLSVEPTHWRSLPPVICYFCCCG